jgi:membrane-associated phospholipid phosphatase
MSVGRLGDDWLIAIDLWLLSSPTYRGVFPVIESRPLFVLLERAYLFLFAEILTVAVWLSAFRPRDGDRWVTRLFAAYAIGLVVFLIWPTVGPHIYAPESLRPEWHETRTFRTMQAMAVDYERIIAGGRGGMNYFIAFPSLHVAAAVVCQLAVRESRALFWMLMPITSLVATSTFFLGYHYAVDVPAGVCTALAATWIVDRLPRRRDFEPVSSPR